MMTTGFGTTTPSIGVSKLNCPLCRRINLRRSLGTVTINKGKETKVVPTDFAHCDYCGVNSVVDAKPFTQELFLSEAYFANTPGVEVFTPEVCSIS